MKKKNLHIKSIFRYSNVGSTDAYCKHWIELNELNKAFGQYHETCGTGIR